MAGENKENNSFTVKIITPERVFFEGDATLLEFHSSEGDIGVLKGHVPMVCVLEPGVLHIHQGDQERKAAMHKGFAQIMPDHVSILAEIAEWPEEIDINRAKEAKIRAERRIQEGSDDLVRDELALRRALARIESID